MTKTEEERLVGKITDRLFGKIKAYLDERFDVPDELLTSEEAAAFLKCKTDQIYRNAKRIPCGTYVGNRPRYTKKNLTDFAKEEERRAALNRRFT